MENTNNYYDVRRSKYWDTSRLTLISILDKYEQLIKDTPNDKELGTKIREYYLNEQEK